MKQNNMYFIREDVVINELEQPAGTTETAAGDEVVSEGFCGQQFFG